MAVDGSLIVAALLLGLGGMPHCVAMCGAPCTLLAARSGARSQAWFHAGRLLGYMAAGALVASTVAGLADLRDTAPLLRPVWTLLHAAACAVGLWMLATARVPAWRAVRTPAPQTVLLRTPQPAGHRAVWMSGPALGLTAGLAWAAWPCGLLQTALLLAALSNDSFGGAAAMGVFALATAPALWCAPNLLRSWAGADTARRTTVRISGLLLAAGSVWALTRDLWPRVAALC